MHERLGGSDHPSLAKYLSNIGVIYGNLRNHKKALEYHFRAIDMFERLYGNGHPDVATSAYYIASSLLNLNDNIDI
jgi:preprotein translocase subunit SecA/nephrocystin-3